MKLSLVIVPLIVLIVVIGGVLYTFRQRSRPPLHSQKIITQNKPKPATQQPGAIQSIEGLTKRVMYQSGALSLTGYLCKPEGTGPFAGVIYNHGGKAGQIGGAPEETCQALAQAGWVGFSPIRREELSFEGNLADVTAGLDYLKKLDYVDPDRLAMIGFSRGGLLTFMIATQNRDLKAIVMMASAPPQQGNLKDFAQKITAPALILVAENDTPSKLNGHQNLVQLAKQMDQALQAAGQSSTLIIYPAYQPTGHLLFFQVGDYWSDVEQFLKQQLLKSLE